MDINRLVDDVISKERGFQKFPKAKYAYTEERAKEFCNNIPIETLIDDPYFMGKKEVIYPRNKEIIIELFERRKQKPTNLFIYLAGIGSGKTYVTACMLWLLVYEVITMPDPHKSFKLDPNTKIAFITMSKNEDLARKVTFGTVLPFFNCPFFNDYFPPQVDMEKLNSNPERLPRELRFPKNIKILPGTGSASSALGMAIHSGVVDEANFLQITEMTERGGVDSGEGVDAAKEMHDTILSRMTSRYQSALIEDKNALPGILAMISSSDSVDDFLERKINEAKEKGEESRTFWVRLPLWDSKPKGTYSDKVFLFDIPRMTILDEIDGDGVCYYCDKKTNKFIHTVHENIEMIFCSVDCYKSIMVSSLRDFDKEDEYTILSVPVDFKQEFIDNPEVALRDKAAMPTKRLYKFIKRWNDLDKCSTDKVSPLKEDGTFSFIPSPLANARYYAHVDMAVTGDGVGFAVGHAVESKLIGSTPYPIIEIDILGSLRGRPNEEFQVSTIDEILSTLLQKGFFFNLVTFDRFQSLATMQKLWQNFRVPVSYLSIDNTQFRPIVDRSVAEFSVRRDTKISGGACAAMYALRTLIYNGCLRLPNFPLVFAEARGLEKITKKRGSGERVVKAKRKSRDAHGNLIISDTDDAIQAVAAVCFSILSNENNLSVFETREREIITASPEMYDTYTDKLKKLKASVGNVGKRIITNEEFDDLSKRPNTADDPDLEGSDDYADKIKSPYYF